MSKQVNKLPKNWSDDELVGWAKGEITAGKDITEEALADEAFTRMGADKGSVEEAKAMILEVAVEVKDEEPTPAPKEEEPAPAPKEEPVKEEPVVAVKEAPAKPAPAPKETPKPVSQNPTALAIEDNLAQYKAKMMPGVAHAGNDGPSAQVKLYRTIQMIMRLDGSDFTREFSNLLKFINEHRTSLFDERYSYRYFDALSLTNPERRNFERILNLLITTCNPSTRAQTMKQVDIDATMEGFKNSDIHQKVVAFYTGV